MALFMPLGSAEKQLGGIKLNWELIRILSIAYAVFALIRHRHKIVSNLRKLPVWARFAFGALLIACAFIPGPVDDFLVIGLIVKFARKAN